ncbi:hypothetical protein [Rossellomorea sp. RS05]|jgi:hypothetical protein|uniref:hypothetical protein n=1 Tax=Rossellomorea sp. RS05 TaxID=3149166 RepID=UPI003221CDFC
MIDPNELMTGPFTLRNAKKHLLPDEAIVTNDDETYYIVRLGDIAKLERMGFRKV